MIIPDEWARAVEHIQQDDRSLAKVMVVGAIDTGKTTFCGLLAKSLWQAGWRTAVVDADLGQSDIGLPTTIGVGVVENWFDTLSEVPCRSAYFVGNVSPVGHLLQTVTGTRLMVDKAISWNCQRIILDTDGLVDGPSGWSLKYHLFQLVQPDWIVMLERHEELASLKALWCRSEKVKILPLAVPPSVRQRGREERKKFREDRFKAYLPLCQFLDLSLQEVRLTNASLGMGRMVPLEEMRRLLPSSIDPESFLGAWQWGRKVTVLAESVPSAGILTVNDLEWIFRTPDEYEQVVVGLLDAEGNLLEVGITFRLDWHRQRLTVLAPRKEQSAPSIVYFGRYRITLSGDEIGTLPVDAL
ncbi:MAG: Clp1/GlmU family protein [Armatimonadetes bacterium]|nr:Clp1/GlmU family protein [Armatimonadota bacterium]MDW8122951.1 Clp1/GlmU family protein [Armatimonadota bacterium]